MTPVQIALFGLVSLCLSLLAAAPFFRLRSLTDQLGTCSLALAALVGCSVLVLKPAPEPMHLTAIERLIAESRLPHLTLQALQDERTKRGQ